VNIAPAEFISQIYFDLSSKLIPVEGSAEKMAEEIHTWCVNTCASIFIFAKGDPRKMLDYLQQIFDELVLNDLLRTQSGVMSDLAATLMMECHKHWVADHGVSPMSLLILLAEDGAKDEEELSLLTSAPFN